MIGQVLTQSPAFKPASLILIVEDEPLLRMMAVDMAEDAGYAVLEAANADEAIVLLETRHDIRLMFTDIDMPHGIDGLKLAASVRDRWPPIEIIVTSGKSFPGAADMPPRALFFRKPYIQRDVVSAMRDLIAA